MALGNSGSRIVGNTEFYGGLSTDNKIGIENSFADAECLDVRKSPSQMTVLPMARTLAYGGISMGLMTAMTQTKDGNIWGIDEKGRLYKIDENDTISDISVTSDSSGFSLESSDIDDGLWWADGGHKLFSYGRILNPTGAARGANAFEFIDDHSEYVDYAIEIQEDGDRIFYHSNPDIKRSAGTHNVSVLTSVDEANDNKILFLPALIPIAKIGIRFTSKGSGNVRIEVHDERDNVVASSKTIAAENVDIAGDFTMFTVRPNPDQPLSAANQFTTTPWSGDTIEAGTVLHIHVIASDSGWTVQSSVEDSLWLTADICSVAYVLHETFNKKHPMSMYDKLYIGNGRYVSTKESTPLNYIDDTLFIQNALRLDDGFEVCSFGSSDEYLMIGAEKYSAGSTRGFQAGRIYFWDRQSEGPNFYIDCNMGSPKCIYNFGNIVYIIIAGALYAYTGGKELVKVRTLKGTDTEFSGQNTVTEVYPNMMAIRREVLLIGFPSTTTAYSIRHGIYAFGSTDKNFPNCFTYNYRIPADTPGGTLEQYNSDTQHLRIGCVYNFNDTLFYSYEEEQIVSGPGGNSSVKRVGLAVVDNTCGTATKFSWKSLQYDAGSPILTKDGLRIGIYFDPLPADTTITPMYRIDNGEWKYGIPATEGKRSTGMDLSDVGRFHEIQYGFVGETGNDMLTPVIKQVSAEIRVLNEELKIVDEDMTYGG